MFSWFSWTWLFFTAMVWGLSLLVSVVIGHWLAHRSLAHRSHRSDISDDVVDELLWDPEEERWT